MAFKGASRQTGGAASQGHLTKGSYVPKLSSELRQTAFGIGLKNSSNVAAEMFARKHGWALRRDPRGWTKCFDPKTGDAGFAPSGVPSKSAVYALSDALKMAEEYSHALIKIFIER